MDGPDLRLSAHHEGIAVRQPVAHVVPLVLASPHSGRDYPAAFVAASRLDPLTLRRSEDSFVDEIFASAPTLGAPLISVSFPRAYLDVNREPYELDPGMFSDVLPSFVNVRSPRVRMGLGTIARVVASGEEIYAGKLRFAEAEQRIEALYRPYHAALRALVDATDAQFGGCLLIDCHSMPSAASMAEGRDSPDIVLGDCHGAACGARIVEAARRFLASRGFAVTLNAPYAGGFTTGHYGHPRRGRHALQIEINRALYMDEQRYVRKPAFDSLQTEMTGLIERLSDIMRDSLRPAG